ncbi:hypothetical protein CWR48_10615 [Oceanobacillus arenosus]|uniref:Uncharacterized protein n=1 Tax=Oceanobacillus arenosus TaxID=1229153 RepID=A0A3D8PS14_9BACI|nr:hypothetical protein [Oceanobacillus arenosus]RDW18048.1 hypothetical protein CWR48_10615 [Oceanobacillus arenosus]
MDIYSDDRILVYVDVDENGVITDAEIGKRIIPSKEFRYFFITEDEEMLTYPEKFKVIDNELVKSAE